MNSNDLINELIDKYGEWLEMAEHEADNLLIDILAKLVLKEREEKEFYKQVAYARTTAK